MVGYGIANINDMLDELEEGKVKQMLSSFSCPLNADVEKFLHKSAVLFAKQGIARTFMVFASYERKPVLVGYFTIATKNFTIKQSNVSSSLFKKVKKYGSHIPELKQCNVSAPLIAQLGKNFSDGYNNLISGDELLKIATDKVKEGQRILGGKVVYLECEDKIRLKNFYAENGFCEFDKRMLDKDERDDLSGEYLLQMIKYIGD